ncbi:MAG: hypothetical protein KAI24_20580, partial [Planctomycetes bacterium]|nr:hypothetical protein [Planctomycetota bacterium]
GNMFDIGAVNAAGITVRNFDVNLDAGTWDLEVYVATSGGTHIGIEQNAASWTLVGSAVGVVGNGPGVPTLLPICVEEFIPASGTQGFYVTCTNGTGINYTTGTGFTQGTLYTSNADVEFFAGTGNVYPFGTIFGPPTASRIWNGNIYYDIGNTVGAGCTFASVAPYGSSCGGNPAGEAQYELHSAFDLSNTGHTYLWTGAGYVLTDGAQPIVPPTNTPTVFSDDQIQAVALGFSMPSPEGNVTDIGVSSNGWMTFDSTVTDNDLSESVAELLNDTWSRIAFLWDDLNPAAGGTINLEQVGPGEFHVTFTDVPEYSNTGANTCQIALFDTGVVEIRYGTCSLLDCLTGVSPGYGAVDLGGIDYSNLGALGAVVINTNVGPFFPNLELTATRPVLGSNWDLTTNNVDPISPIAITFLGDRSPVSIPLVAIGINAPGCEAHLATILGSLTGVTTAGSTTVSLPIPNSPSLAGALLAGQSLGLTLSNSANIVVSNGVEGTLGN